MWRIWFLSFLALSQGQLAPNATAQQDPTTTLMPKEPELPPNSRKNFSINGTLLENVLTRKDNEGEKDLNELEGVVLALSMKKNKSGMPKWYSHIKNAAKNLFTNINQRRFRQIRFRGQDPSVTIDLKADAIVPALKELLASKQVQKILNALASKAAIVYRAFQEDYVKENS